MDVELYIETGEELVTEQAFVYSESQTPMNRGILSVNKNNLEYDNFTFLIGSRYPVLNVEDIKKQSDGKFILVGFFTTYDGVSSEGIVRVNPDGTRDSTFNVGGSGFHIDSSSAGSPRTLLIEDDGKILVGGSSMSYNGGLPGTDIVRINSNGSMYSSLNLFTTGSVNTLKKDLNSKILVGGSFVTTAFASSRVAICRLNSDAVSLDTSFNANIIELIAGSATTKSSVSSIINLEDGKLLIAGHFNIGGVNYLMARLNSDGSLDSTFLHKFASGVSGSPLYSSRVLLDSQNRIIMYGADSVDGSLVRYSYDGEIDTTFTYYGESYVFSAIENVDKGYIISSVNISSGYDNYPIGSIVPIEYSGDLQQDWVDMYNSVVVHTVDYGFVGSTNISTKFFLDTETLFACHQVIISVPTVYNYIKQNTTTQEVLRTTYERLDMFDDEKISIKLKNSDSSDLGKVFSEFSQGFSVPPSDKNNRLLRYNYKTEVVTNKKTKFKAKIYIKGNLFKSGNFIVGETKFKNLRPSSHSLNFVSSVFNLKDIVKEDTLNDLNLFGGDNNWTLSRANTAITTPSSTFICPLITTNKVWNYGLGGVGDISLTANKLKLRDLRPASSFKTIFNKIVDKYNLNIDFPFKEDPEFYNLFMWLNGYTEPPVRGLNFTNSFGAVSNPSSLFVGQVPVINTTTDIVTVTKTTTTRDYMFLNTYSTIDNVVNTDNLSVTLNIIDMRPGKEGNLLGSSTIENEVGGTFNFRHRLDSFKVGLSAGQPLLYKLEYKSNFPITVAPITHTYRVMPLLSGGISMYSYTSSNNQISGQAIDLNKSFPDMKVIDFLTGIVKLFNIEISSDKYVPNKMYWKPKSTIVREVLDLTGAIDIKESSAKSPKRYKKFEFRHKENNFYSTEAFKIANVANPNSKAYGELIYTDEEEVTDSSYKVESPFAITPTRLLEGSNIEYMYGFEYDAEVSTNFKPNSKDILIFYNVGSETIKKEDESNGTIYLDNGSGGQYSVTRYNKVSNTNNSLEELYTNSIGYKDEVNENPFFIYNKNLFSNFYEDDIVRLYNRGTKVFTYNSVLNANQILYLSADKDIIIGDEKFSIEEVDLDVTNGKAKFTIMNYAPVNLVVVNYPVTPPTVFTATLL